MGPVFAALQNIAEVKPGEVRNPAGRPKGSRNKLSDAFLQALADDFEAHGKGVVETVRTERPQAALERAVRAVSALPPITDVGRHIQVRIWLSVYAYTA